MPNPLRRIRVPARWCKVHDTVAFGDDDTCVDAPPRDEGASCQLVALFYRVRVSPNDQDGEQ